MSPTPQVAIVEQHSLMRRGWESLLAESGLARVEAAVAHIADLSDPGRRRYDVIVYGPPVRGTGFTEGVAALTRSGRVLVVADIVGGQPVTQALRAGAFGCVDQQADERELLRAVETVAGGGLHIAPGLAPRLHSELRHPSSPVAPPLTQREREALRLLALGLTHGQIARRMGLAEVTVSTYVKRIRGKLGAGNKAELARKAIEMGLLREDSPETRVLLPGFPRSA
ncbi:response regulator transcription factor [Streptomyces sp. NPDC047061]|uniref:response regulator transcription factor n=1 Tax=Streptomyces sp. NPDC047061 TaxID=3154605 RepID=UPI0033E8433C